MLVLLAHMTRILIYMIIEYTYFLQYFNLKSNIIHSYMAKIIFKN